MGIGVFYDEEPDVVQGGLRTKNNRSLDESFDSYESKNLHDVEVAPMLDPKRTVTIMDHVNSNYQKRMNVLKQHTKRSKRSHSPRRTWEGVLPAQYRNRRTGILFLAGIIIVFVIIISTMTTRRKNSSPAPVVPGDGNTNTETSTPGDGNTDTSTPSNDNGDGNTDTSTPGDDTANTDSDNEDDEVKSAYLRMFMSIVSH